ncbi:proteasome subunit beta type-3 [Parasteatoda tepidariorum]|uniref:proteasome subunit beta type-3 n=1 Tax=Parasteatoda tepidariorum TaxID=114398 RepID=UPI00077F96CB|nr:proteasome subunit beta type-3 [Parasteatoda tepidariorum]
MSIFEYNGGLVIAMTGKNCFAIASDRRLGVRAQTVSMDFKKIYELGPRLYVGLPGLATDTATVAQKLQFRVNMYELREDRKMRPAVLQSVLSNLLYEMRFGPFFVSPIVAGLEPGTNEPYICGLDVIGSGRPVEDFVVSGTCEDQAFGMCEALWEKDMEPDILFEKISQALVNSCDRDAISGWGGIVHIVEKDKVTTKILKTRMD